MDSFSSPSASGSPGSTEQIMDQIKAQLAQAYAQEFLELCNPRANSSSWQWIRKHNKSFLEQQATQSVHIHTVGNKCFAKCVTKPGTSLSGSESSCISRCVDRYIEATGIISRALFSSQR